MLLYLIFKIKVLDLYSPSHISSYTFTCIFTKTDRVCILMYQDHTLHIFFFLLLLRINIIHIVSGLGSCCFNSFFKLKFWIYIALSHISSYIFTCIFTRIDRVYILMYKPSRLPAKQISFDLTAFFNIKNGGSMTQESK
jgi:hypothetical protein